MHSVSLHHLVPDMVRWATPMVPNGGRMPKGGAMTLTGMTPEGKKRQVDLNFQVRNWNTPTTLLASIRSEAGMPNTLAGDVANWDTPAARDFRTPMTAETAERRSLESSRGVPLEEQVMSGADRQNERLSPDWEETLMGWEIGWTDATKPCAGIFPGFPMGQGYEQYAYEPPRTVHKDECPGRTKRIGMIGNGVVPQQAEIAFYLLLSEVLA